ncbi:MAG: damage repair protein [Bacilli bacterium]|nr:damage repair protein [Bacilli bacterium]
MEQRNIAVIDLKAFYAFVECIDRGLDPFSAPLIVADRERGNNTIILSVSPYLKKNGVPSRLRVRDLPKKFNYIFATPRMSRYIEKSAEIVSIIMSFFAKEDVHVYSIDESFIDITSYLKYYGKTPVELVQMVIDKITEQTGLMATAGIGDNFFLSKVALDIYAKHEKNGIAVMRKDDVPNKLWPITPLSKIWGIGPRLEKRLNNMGIFTVQDLAFSNRDYIKSKLGIIGEQLIDHANGIDESDVHEVYVPKENSLSIGQTLWKDYSKDEAPLLIKEMVDDLAHRMRDEGKLTCVVSLYIGYSKCQGGFARQMSLLGATDNTQKLLDAVMDIYNMYIQDIPIRNISINFGKLSKSNMQQLNIFEDQDKQVSDHKLQLTMDKLHNKYGKNILTRASALLENSTTKERHNQIGGHRK